MLKNTAANRIITDDFEVPAILGDIDLASDTLARAGGQKVEAQLAYDNAKRRVDHESSMIEQVVISDALKADPKTSQVAIDRAIKRAKLDNAELASREKAMRIAKSDLDAAQVDYDLARYNHRGLTAKANVTAASLNFLGNTKMARTAALKLLGEV